MSERDRLAALLHEPCEERWREREAAIPGYQTTLHAIDAHYADADRLIAAGVGVPADLATRIEERVAALPTWDKRSVPGGLHVNRAAVLAIVREEATRG